LGTHLAFKVNFLQAFYWTLALVTSVGSSNLHPIGTTQIVYTSVLLVFGTALWLYWVSVIVAAFVSFDKTRKERHFMDQLKRLDDHYVILGAGRVGLAVARELRQSGIRSIVIADTDQVRLHAADNDDWLTLVVASYEVEHLGLLHLDRAKALVVALPDDAQTLFAYLSVREINPQLRVAARARAPETARRLQQLGADDVILPDASSGRRMARWLVKPHAHELMSVLTNEEGVRIHEIEVGSNHLMLGRPVRQVRQTFGQHYTLLGYWRNGVPYLAPPADDNIAVGDVLILLERVPQEIGVAESVPEKTV
jgi:voltage-gated potassium channel